MSETTERGVGRDGHPRRPSAFQGELTIKTADAQPIYRDPSPSSIILSHKISYRSFREKTTPSPQTLGSLHDPCAALVVLGDKKLFCRLLQKQGRCGHLFLLISRLTQRRQRLLHHTYPEKTLTGTSGPVLTGAQGKKNEYICNIFYIPSTPATSMPGATPCPAGRSSRVSALLLRIHGKRSPCAHPAPPGRAAEPHNPRVTPFPILLTLQRGLWLLASPVLFPLLYKQ